MVNQYDNDNEEVTVLKDEHHEEHDDIELAEEEAAGAGKLKQLRQKIARLDEEKRLILEETAREKADFLNARKRLEQERVLDRIRFTKKHIETLLPLCDSFDSARSNKELWEKADEQWRKGIEGIHAQLIKILDSYKVSEVATIGDTFDPRQHEAISTSPVSDKALDHTIVTILQKGYAMDVDGTLEVIRPARVTIGEYTE